jgi:hypothetical protein
MLVVLWTRKREKQIEDENNVEIRADMRNQGHDLPDWVGKTLYRCDYMPDRDQNLLYR